MFRLSPKEMELMELLWDAGVPLARQEILNRAACRTCTWKPNSIHILLNSLLQKGAVRVDGFYMSSRKLGRTFAVAVTREEYVAMQVKLALLEARRLTGIDPEKLLKDLSAQAADGSWEETA